MTDQAKREKALKTWRQGRKMTEANGCTPDEAKTAAKIVEAMAAKWGFTAADAAESGGRESDGRSNARQEYDDGWRRAKERAAADAEARRQAKGRAAADAEAKREREEQAERDAKAKADKKARKKADDQAWSDSRSGAAAPPGFEYRKCGKKTCWCAQEAKGGGHGPYRYTKRRRGAAVNSVYVGK